MPSYLVLLLLLSDHNRTKINAGVDYSGTSGPLLWRGPSFLPEGFVLIELNHGRYRRHPRRRSDPRLPMFPHPSPVVSYQNKYFAALCATT